MFLNTPNLVHIWASGLTGLYGDIASFANTDMRDMSISVTSISGDINSLTSLSKLHTCYLVQATNLYGDISVFANMPDMLHLRVDDIPSVTGNIASLASLTKLLDLYVNT